MTIKFYKNAENILRKIYSGFNQTVWCTFTRLKGRCVCFWFFLRLVTQNKVLLEDMQQLGVGATLDTYTNSIKQVTNVFIRRFLSAVCPLLI